jgi:hypothetical protein
MHEAPLHLHDDYHGGTCFGFGILRKWGAMCDQLASLVFLAFGLNEKQPFGLVHNGKDSYHGALPIC